MKIKLKKGRRKVFLFERTSLEANKEATPMGTKIMLTNMNAEITCTRRDSTLILSSDYNKDRRIYIYIYNKNNNKAYPSWCENGFTRWKFLLGKPRIWERISFQFP